MDRRSTKFKLKTVGNKRPRSNAATLARKIAASASRTTATAPRTVAAPTAPRTTIAAATAPRTTTVATAPQTTTAAAAPRPAATAAARPGSAAAARPGSAAAGPAAAAAGPAVAAARPAAAAGSAATAAARPQSHTLNADYREQAGPAELLASQAATSLTQSERVKLWKNTTGVRSKKNRVYSHPLDSDNSDFEGPSSKGSSSQTNEQLKDLSEKVDGLLGLHKTVEGMQVMLGRIAERLDVNQAEV